MKLPMKRRIAAIALWGAVCWQAALWGGFVWDDHWLILDNPHVQNPSIGNLVDAFSHNLGNASGVENAFYRPLQETTYMLDRLLWAKVAFGFHLGNLLLHVINAVLLMVLVERLTADPLASTAAAALWMSHPVHTEAVAYIAGRADLLAGVFMLITLLCLDDHLRGRGRGKLALASLAYAAALLSKEIAMVLPLLLLLYERLIHGSARRWKDTLLTAAPFWSLLAGYLYLRAVVIDYSAPSAPITVYQRLVTAPVLLAEYIRLMVWPVGLHMERFIPFSVSMLELRVISGMLVCGGTVLLAVLWTRNDRPSLFGTSWFGLTLLPTLNVLSLLNASMAEHWLYIPTMGLAVPAARGIRYLVDTALRGDTLRRKATAAAGAAILVLAAIRANAYAWVWRDEAQLYTYTLRYGETPRLYHAIARVWKERFKNLEMAEQCTKKALEMSPDDPSAWYNLGLIQAQRHHFEEAEKSLRKAVKHAPNHYKAWTALGNVLMLSGKKAEAVEAFQRALHIRSDFVPAWKNLAACYMRMGRKEDALRTLRKASSVVPQDASLRKAIEELERKE